MVLREHFVGDGCPIGSGRVIPTQMTHFVGDACEPDGHRTEQEKYEKETLKRVSFPDCEVSSAPTVSIPHYES